jgi:hypothetical protein
MVNVDNKVNIQKALKEESNWNETNREARAQTETLPGGSPTKFPLELSG